MDLYPQAGPNSREWQIPEVRREPHCFRTKRSTNALGTSPSSPAFPLMSWLRFTGQPGETLILGYG